MTKPKVTPPWRPPTRRAFVAMLGMAGAAAAALTLRSKKKRESAATTKATTRWIGHC
jgi:hypothetical protein